MQWVVFFLCLIFACIVIPVGVYTNDPWPNGEFSGQEIFESEEEYSKFKTALTETSWDLDYVKTLSSKPPILVDFWNVEDPTHQFPYGKESTSWEGFNTFLVVMGGLALFVALVILLAEAQEA